MVREMITTTMIIIKTRQCQSNRNEGYETCLKGFTVHQNIIIKKKTNLKIRKKKKMKKKKMEERK